MNTLKIAVNYVFNYFTRILINIEVISLSYQRKLTQGTICIFTVRIYLSFYNSKIQSIL